MTATIVIDHANLAAWVHGDGAPVGAGLGRYAAPAATPADNLDWQYSVTGEGRHVCDAAGRVVAQVVGGADWREADRIGDLLASAPALATALRELCAVIEETWLPHELPLVMTAALLGARVALEGTGQPVG